MPKKVFRAIYAVNYCIQAGFCMVCPAGLIILGGWLLRTRCGLGRWIMIAAIVFGVFAGLYSMFQKVPCRRNHGNGQEPARYRQRKVHKMRQVS